MRNSKSEIPFICPVFWFLLAFLLPLTVNGQTLISGNVSGTWSPANNPYVIIDNTTVPSGQTLTVDPGTEVIIGSNLDLTVNGLIKAKGTPTDRIAIRGANNSTPFNHIQLINTSFGTNEFDYCDFRSATEAIYMYVTGSNTMVVTINNCTFSNCVNYGISGNVYGPSTLVLTELEPMIRNCAFSSITGDACNFYLYGGAAHAHSRFAGNIFQGVHGAAIAFRAHETSDTASSKIINNTFVDCGTGIDAGPPTDALIEDNILLQCGIGVTRSGSFSSAVGFNCFYQDSTNFVGYPLSYGQVVFNNRNGTPCDVAYNILQDPLFVSTNDFHLVTNSPCIDAGTPDWAWSDMCFPPSQGTAYPDLGAYGGPDACNWLTNVPVIAAKPWMSQSNGVVSINWGALPRSTYEIQCNTNWMGTNWVALKEVTAIEKPTSVAITTTNRDEYYRIESLGRTPGN